MTKLTYFVVGLKICLAIDNGGVIVDSVTSAPKDVALMPLSEKSPDETHLRILSADWLACGGVGFKFRLFDV